MFLTTVTDLAQPVWALVLPLTDESPKPEDVKAGWTAFAIFILLGLAVVLLAVSLVKQLKKAQAAKDAGVYGDDPAEPGAPGGPGAPGASAGPTGPAEKPANHDQPSS